MNDFFPEIEGRSPARDFCPTLPFSDHSIPAERLFAEIAAYPGRTRLELSAGGWSSPAYLNVIYRQSDLVIGTFLA